MGISVFLHQIPCWAELCQLLANMSDEEINDLISIAWDWGNCIDWPDESNNKDGGISKFIPWNTETDPKNVDEQITERFSVALKYIHDKKIKGEYISKDIDIQLKCGGKNGKFWKLKTNNCSYTVSYGKLRNNSAVNPQTMCKSFRTADDCYKEAQKKIKEKKKKKYKLDYDNKSGNSINGKYNNEYLELAQEMDGIIHVCEQKKKQFANVIGIATNGLFGGDICFIISEFCNEDKIDHYNADKVFDDIGCPNTPIARLMECVKSIKDKSPSAFDRHLLEGIYGNGQEFGKDVCYGSIRVFSPKEMKIFASRMIKRLIENGDDELKAIIFGIDEIKIEEEKDDESGNIREPSVKRRKLNDSNVKSVDGEDVYGNEVIYKVAYGLSASGIFDKKKQDIVWKKVFRLDENNILQSCYEGNHSLCVLSFGLNAAAMNRGVIAHYW